MLQIGPLLCHLVDLSYGTLIGMLMGPLLSNYMGRYLEAFLVFPLYFYLFRLYKPFLTVSLDTISSSWLWTSHLGQKARYPDLVDSPLQSTLAVPPLVYCPKFVPPPSGSYLTSPLQATLAETLYGGVTHSPSTECAQLALPPVQRQQESTN